MNADWQNTMEIPSSICAHEEAVEISQEILKKMKQNSVTEKLLEVSPGKEVIFMGENGHWRTLHLCSSNTLVTNVPIM